jgi:hypothetical protein
MQIKEFCGATWPSKVLKGKRGNSQCPLIAPRKFAVNDACKSLAAYAQRLGATGLTFFDDDVIQFFSPHAKDKSAMFLLAIGKPKALAI